MAAAICDVPIALVSLIDKNRQWFKSHHGLDARETPRDLAFCAHAIHQDGVFYIPDSSKDERFHDNPLVTGAPEVKFYAGYSLNLRDDLRIGTLCVIDNKPRELTDAQIDALTRLGRQVEDQLRMRLKVKKLEGLERQLREQVQVVNESERRSEELSQRLRLALEASDMGVWDYNIKTKGLLWDENMCRMYGVDPEKASATVNYSLWENAVIEEDRDRVTKEVFTCAETATRFDSEFRIRREDGSLRYIRALAKVFKDQDGNPARMVGVNWDITEMRLQQKKIETSHRRFQLVSQGSSVGIWDWKDINKEEEFWSDRFYTLLGYKPGEIPATVESFKSLLHPDDIEPTFRAVESHFQRQDAFDVEYRLRLKNGEYRWFHGTGQAEFDANGNPTRMAGSIADIDALKRSSEEMEAFLYTVSHDLKAPLVSIKGFLGRFDRVKNQLGEKEQVWLGRISANADHMRRLLDDLLEMSRTSRLNFEFKNCSLKDLAAESIALQSGEHEDRGVTVDVADLPVVRCDPERTKQVLSNLIENALKYNPSSSPKISVGFKEAGEWWRFSVEDNGPGIPEEYLERVFKIFERINPEASSGTGLGLAICKLIVEKQGGRIWVESVMGQGSTFYFTLPKAA